LEEAKGMGKPSGGRKGEKGEEKERWEPPRGLASLMEGTPYKGKNSQKRVKGK